jgi:serine/threonine protein kinase
VGEIRGMRPTDPAQVAGYRLTGILGEGGQGTVYLGEDEGGRHVAVKMVHPHLLIDDQVALDGILREVQIAGRLARFCTAQVITTGEEDGRPYVVSEYVSGPTLEESVRSEGPRSEASLHRLGVATATALSAIHRAGVLHRDFKPHNVILGPDGPVVIDFGIARVLNSAVRSTMTGQLLGTPSYVAPEQIRHLATGLHHGLRGHWPAAVRGLHLAGNFPSGGKRRAGTRRHSGPAPRPARRLPGQGPRGTADHRPGPARAHRASG